MVKTVPQDGAAMSSPFCNSAFLSACRGQETDFTPIWLMRQAGRYMEEYRSIRDKMSFLDMCKQPDLAAYVTIVAAEKLGVDAAIIFADILLLLEPMGVGLSYLKGDGPQIGRPVRCQSDIDRLLTFQPVESLSFVMEAIKKTRAGLSAAIPLIGFAGAPFTLASYLVEGGPSRNFENTKILIYREPQSWRCLMTMLTGLTIDYLNAQIDAGAQAVQLFDSWVGCLSTRDYEDFVLPYSRQVVSGIKPGVPVIHFGTGTAHLLKAMREAGGDVIGLDWRLPLRQAWQAAGHDVAVQGNLDPAVLLAEPEEIKARAELILRQAAGRPGHIFNLGHGVLPMTPVENVKYLVEVVHEFGKS